MPVEVVQEPVVQQQQQQPKKESKKNKKSNKPKDELILQPKTSLDDLLQLVCDFLPSYHSACRRGCIGCKCTVDFWDIAVFEVKIMGEIKKFATIALT